MRVERRAFAQSLTPDTRTALERALVDTLSPLLFAASVVAGYFPMTGEISVLPALGRAAGR